MANYYLDFVGLNTFIYEANGWDINSQSPVVGSDTSITYGNEKLASGGTFQTKQNHLGLFEGDNLPPEDQSGLRRYKNTLFSHNLPTTASFFPALMLHRNGPYGHPTWKQIRTGQNPLTRKQLKENIFTHVEEPGSSIVIQGAQVNRRYGDIKAFVETPVISRYKPVMIRGASSVISERSGRTTLERFTINSSFGNSLVHFNNEELDKYYNFIDQSDDAYDEIKQLYLEDGLNSPDSPMDIFEFVRYSETIYPTQFYTNKNYTRQRTNFSFDWRDDILDRIEVDVDDGFGNTVQELSFWPLDVDDTWPTMNKAGNTIGFDSGRGYGILQNTYCTFDGALASFVLSEQINEKLRPEPIYNRKHFLLPSASVVSQNGMKIEGINFGTLFNNMETANSQVTGEAKWEAGDQAGKNPFYDSYDDYIQGVRQRGKGYSIIPEFRISNHIPTIVAEGVDKKLSNLFEITGGLSSADGSDEENFFKVYSTSEFLRHFDLVKEDHKGFVDPTRIKLKCKAIKKFLPYNGFYPCQRTVEIAQQFYSSYSDAVTVATGSTFDFQPLADSAKIGFQNLLAPLFAPGVLFNAIKSGVACDYPIITGSISIANRRILKDGDNYYLMQHPSALAAPTTIFDKRIPFSALVEPERFLSQQPIFCNEPQIDANHSSSVFWDGSGDSLYKMMAHNFLAEVPDFFLQGQQFSTIYSLPSNDPKVGNAVSGSTYKMRVKMFKSISGSSNPVFSGSATNDGYYITPQYSSNVSENFTMYSRPSAFGPPSRTTSSYAVLTTGSNSDIGENYPFTPPYYYGQAWADIKFVAKQTKKYSIDEIIRDSEVKYWRFVDPNSSQGGILATNPAGIRNNLYNNNAMQLDASLNLFAQGDIDSVDLLDDSSSDKVNIAVDISSDKKSRWIIQPYFETPMLNFNHLSASTSLTLPTFGSQSVPRGMWHQYGRIETDSSKGVFVQVTDVPDDFRIKVSGSLFDKSLAKLCGFKDEPKRLGQVAQSKVISEAVVAIPFIEEEGDRKFFKISDEAIQVANSNILNDKSKEERAGKSILRMVEKMKKFVIPPSFDFVHRKDVDPFAMYIFEFNHTLDQQDLADIWQNLPPSIGRSFEEATATISHPLLASELLSEGTMEDGKKVKGNPLPDKIRWLVFKAKQRAETNYYNKVVGERDLKQNTSAIEKARQNKLIDDASSILRPEGYGTNVSYNWPYDFFSLVELVKIDAEVTLSDSDALLREEDNIVIKRGVRGIAGLPARAQQRIRQRNNEEDDDSQTSPQRAGRSR